MDIKQYLREYKGIFERALLASIKDRPQQISLKLQQAMQYSLEAGGKRVRPILAIAACQAAGGELEEVMPFALALEYIHTYSLIHDDLPAMDDDDLRRGKPTNHKVYGEATAILAGDALLTDAFLLIAQENNNNLSAENRLQGIKLLADAAGENGMVGGQSLDIEFSGKDFTLEELTAIHRNKTGRLLCAAVELGALAANAELSVSTKLKSYGQALGFAFQLKDDLLDLESSEDIGKDKGSDLKNKKATIVALLGGKKAKKELEKQLTIAQGALKDLDQRAEPLRQIANYIVNRGN